MPKKPDDAEEGDEIIHVRVPAEIKQTLESAKQQTGASYTFLVVEAVKTKWARYAPKEAA